MAFRAFSPQLEACETHAVPDLLRSRHHKFSSLAASNLAYYEQRENILFKISLQILQNGYHLSNCETE